MYAIVRTYNRCHIPIALPQYYIVGMLYGWQPYNSPEPCMYRAVAESLYRAKAVQLTTTVGTVFLPCLKCPSDLFDFMKDNWSHAGWTGSGVGGHRHDQSNFQEHTLKELRKKKVGEARHWRGDVQQRWKKVEQTDPDATAVRRILHTRRWSSASKWPPKMAV
jgi:hypothetical protein